MPGPIDTTPAFPAALDTFTALSGTDICGDVDLAGHITFVQNVAEAIEAEIGITGDTSTSTIIGRLHALESGGGGGGAPSEYVSTTTLTAMGGETSIVTQAAWIAGTLLIFKNGSLLAPPYSATGMIISITAATAADVYVVTYRTTTASPAASSLSNLVPEAISAWPKLVAWYELNETSGSTLHDSHTGGYHLTISGSPMLNQPAVRSGGGASVFFGSGAMAENLAGPNLFGAASLSVISWIKPNANPANGTYAMIAACWSPVTNDTAYWLCLDGSNRQKTCWTNGGANNFNTDTGAALSASTPYLVGYSQYFGTTKTIDYYTNGAISSGPTAFTNNQSGGTDTRIMLGGLDIYALYYYANSYLQGTAIFVPALTASEHAYIDNGGAGVSYAQFKSNSGH